MENVRNALNLAPHPEGGAFAEVFRSARRVRPLDAAGAERSALTHIYFHLEPGEVSRFHRVAADEAWHLYEGGGVILHQWREGAGSVERIRLGRDRRRYCHVVPAGTWQAAEPVDGPVLVGCSVGPGFEFEDFELAGSEGPVARAIRSIDPSLGRFL
ncbi:MAG: cupin domain-containing protein [Puniceicoccaceae bacterium]